MKKLLFCGLLLSLISVTSCKKDEVLEQPKPPKNLGDLTNDGL